MEIRPYPFRYHFYDDTYTMISLASVQVSSNELFDTVPGLIVDLIVSEIECGECLCEKASMVSEGEMVSV